MSNHTQFAATIQTGDDPIDVAQRAAAAIRQQLDGRVPTLVAMFVSPALAADPWTLSATIRGELSCDHLFGCTSEAPVGAGLEMEGVPALALWATAAAGVRPHMTHLTIDRSGSLSEVERWQREVFDMPPQTPLILLADPFTFATDLLIGAHNRAGLSPIVGGLASGGHREGEHVLFLGEAVHFEGAVAAALPGLQAQAVVSQGCEPIGPDMVITAGSGPCIEELAGTRAYTKIMSVLDDLGDDERLRRGMIFGGIVIDENVPEYRRGDFLVRALHGRDPYNDAVIIGDDVRVGQTFHLQLRDSTSADDDLRSALQPFAADSPARTQGALIFTCNGRGQSMFGTPHHDAAAVRDALNVPAAGMYCNGEIGPVGGRSFIHGYSVSLLVFTAAPEKR